MTSNNQELTLNLAERLAALDTLRGELAEAQVELDLARSEAEAIVKDAQRRASEIVTDAAKEYNETAEKYRISLKSAAELVQPAVLKSLGHTAPKDARLPKPIPAPVELASAA